MANPVEALPKKEIPGEKKEKEPEGIRKEFRVIKGGGRKGWGPGAKAGAIVGSTATVVSGVAAVLGETDNLPDPLQGFYNRAFRPSKVAEEVSEKVVRGKYDVEKASEDLTKIVNETKKETKETPVKIEWEGIVVPSIEGTKFDKGIFYFLEGNEYGGKAGEKAGVFVKDGLEVNGKIENAIGLDSRMIEFKEKEIFERTKERLFPIFIDLTKYEGVKLQELDTAGEEIGRKILGFSLYVGTEFLAPLSGGWGMFKPFPNLEDKQFFTNWDTGVKGELGRWEIYFRDAEILARMEEEGSILNPKDGKMQTFMGAKVKLGDTLGEITSNAPLENFSKSDWGDYQIVTFLENEDRIMEVGNGNTVYKVFIFNQ
jgi:hypothetical protein